MFLATPCEFVIAPKFKVNLKRESNGFNKESDFKGLLYAGFQALAFGIKRHGDAEHPNSRRNDTLF